MIPLLVTLAAITVPIGVGVLIAHMRAEEQRYEAIRENVAAKRLAEQAQQERLAAWVEAWESDGRYYDRTGVHRTTLRLPAERQRIGPATAKALRLREWGR